MILRNFRRNALAFLIFFLAAPGFFAETKSGEEQSPASKITVIVNTASTNVTVLTDKNFPVVEPKLQKENFRIYECKDAKKRKECVEQEITNFGSVDAPITAVFLLDYSRTNFRLACLGEIDPYACYQNMVMGHLREAPEAFLGRLKENDKFALVWFDMKPHIATDFTSDKREFLQELNKLLVLPPASNESLVYDTLLDTIDRIEEAQKEGREGMERVAIVLFGTGYDSFSKATLDKVLRRVKNTPVVIYTVRIGQAYRNLHDTGQIEGNFMPLIEAINNMNQSQNVMENLAKLTGGKAYSPAFTGEFIPIFEEISAMLRAQYTIGWQIKPENMDGKYHEILVEVAGNFVDQNTGRPLKLKAIHRQGYIAEKAK